MTYGKYQMRPIRAVGLLALLAILAIAISVALLLSNLRARDLEHSRLEMVSLTKAFIRQTEQNLGNIDLVLLGVQERLQTAYGRQFDLGSVPTHLLLGARVASMRDISALFIVDADGHVVNSSREYPVETQLVTDRRYFTAFTHGSDPGLLIDHPVRSRRDGTWSWHLARRLSGPNGKLQGVLVATVNVAQFEQLYNFVKLDFDRPFSIYMEDGTLIASIPHREAQIGDRAPELGTEALPAPGEDIRMRTHARGDGGRQRFALGRSAQFPVLVSVTDDEDEALLSWRETAWPILGGSALICALIAIATGVLIGELLREQDLAKALSGAHDRYHRTVDSLMDGIVAIDESQRILVFNKAAEHMFGRKAEDVLGQTLDLLLPDNAHAIHQQHVADFARQGPMSKAMGPQLEIIGRRANGSEFPIESTISKTVVGGKRQMTAVLRDITERQRNEENLRALNLQLRKFSESLQSVREEERSRISRELHDELGQQLTGLKLEFAWLGSRLLEGRTVVYDDIASMRAALDTALASVRRISTELRPLILDELGFAEGIQWLSGEFSKRTGVHTTLDMSDASHIQDETLASGLFRIVQESLTNITRHAQARNVEIRIAMEADHLLLSVRDDGKGIADVAKRSDSIGLLSMRERAIAMGASFAIESSAGVGCTVSVKLPPSALNSKKETV